jgi:hypothetical protein
VEYAKQSCAATRDEATHDASHVKALNLTTVAGKSSILPIV